MINTSEHKNEDIVKSGVVDYPIGFPFYFNPDRTPQLRVKIGDEELRFNHNFKLSEDKGSVVLMPTEEESWTLEGPEDFSWMAKWDGKDLLIERAVPFVQDSDYQLGRISSEQIERDFDLSVMRDQILDDKIDTKLPLSGGTLTGPLTIVGDRAFAASVLTLKHADSDSAYTVYAGTAGVQMPFNLYGMYSISPSTYDGPQSLGTKFSRWDTVYATKINNGLDISIPEKSGTMALLEDVESKADKTELSNYLPLTGGDLRGRAIFDIGGTAGKNIGLIGVKTASGVAALIGAKADDNGVLRDVAVISKLQSDTVQGQQIYASFIGSIDHPVTRIHAKKIGVGLTTNLLTIPDEEGTIARLEDIPKTYTKDELNTKFAEIDAKLSSVYKFKGSVANVEALPTGADVGDTYNVEDSGANYAWDGSKWDKLSDTIDLSNYATLEDINAIGGDGAEGQVLTKTEEGFEWKDATGGGSTGPEYKNIKIDFSLESYDWSGNQTKVYKVGFPESLRHLPAGIYSCELILLTPNGTDVSMLPNGDATMGSFAYKVSFIKRYSDDESIIMWGSKIDTLVSVSPTDSLTPYSMSYSSDKKYFVADEYGTVFGDVSYYQQELETNGWIQEPEKYFGLFDMTQWFDWETNNSSFRARVSKLRNESTGETFDYPDISVAEGSEVSSITFNGVISPYGFDKLMLISEVLAGIPSQSSNYYQYVEYTGAPVKTIFMSLPFYFCFSDQVVEDNSFPQAPWSYRVSIMTESLDSTMTFEVSGGFKTATVSIFEKSGKFAKVDYFSIDNFGTGLNICCSDESAFLEEGVHVKCVLQASAPRTGLEVYMFDVASKADYKIKTITVGEAESLIGDISTALTAILGE